MVYAFILIAVTVLVYAVGFAVLKKKEAYKNKAFTQRLITTGFANFLLCGLCITWFFLCSNSNSFSYIIPYILVTAAMFFGFVIVPFSKSEKLKKYFKMCTILIIASFVVELLIFNAKSFDLNNYEFSPASISTETPDSVKTTGNNVVLTGDGNLVFDIEKENLHALEIGLNISGNKSVVKCTASMTDGNFGVNFIDVDNTTLTSNDKKGYLSFNPYKTLKKFKLTFSGLEKNNTSVTITDIKFMSAVPFDFSVVRFLVLFILLAGIYSIYYFKLFKVKYNEQSKTHQYIIVGATLLCVLSSFAFFTPDNSTIKYSDQINLSYSDPYVQMFDAVQKGQVNIDIPVSDSFKSIENPYDVQQRTNSGEFYAWDRAYYEGNYYSYFGIVPVFVLYIPFYILTGTLPSLNFNITFFSILSMIFLIQTILTLTKMFIKKPNLFLLVLGIFSATACSGIYYALDFSDIYFPAKVSSICFMLLCVWLGLCAYKTKSVKKQLILLIFSGLSFILCVGCRPSVAISAFVLAPFFIAILMNKKYTVKRKICCASSFIVPILVGAIGLMWYNYARFGSLFDFGSNYQLTVSNISANSLRLSAFPDAVIHYFFHPFAFTAEFPFFRAQTMSLQSYGQYVYTDSFFGAVNFPFIFIGLIISIYLLFHDRKKIRRIGKDDGLKYYTYLLMVVLTFLIAWSVFCLAGVAFGYMLDILPLLSILAVLVFLDIHKRLEKYPTIQTKAFSAISVIMVVSVIIVFLHLLTYTSQNLCNNFIGLKSAVENMLIFWK